MRFTTIGQNGELSISVIGFGTYHLTDKVGEAEAIRCLHAAQASGIELVDTSDNYRTELLVGHALYHSPQPEQLIIATKTGLATTYEEHLRLIKQQRQADTSPARVRSHLGDSLRMLGMGSVHLYQLHGYDHTVSPEDLAITMHELVAKERCALYWGVSNYTYEQLERLLAACDKLDTVRPATLQQFYNLITNASDSVVDLASDQGMTLLAHSPLHKGMLAEGLLDDYEKVVEQAIKENTDEKFAKLYEKMRSAIWQIRRLQAYANEHGYTLSEFALAWLVNRPLTIALTACTNVEYLEAADNATNWIIDDYGMSLVEEVRNDEAITACWSGMLNYARETKHYYR